MQVPVKEIHTNKAKLIFKDDGTVDKIFFDATTAEKEMQSLSQLNQVFINKEIDGWIYKAVEFIDYEADNNKIIMGIVNGINFSDLFRDKPEYSNHMGIWLAIYHNCAVVEEDKVILYGDFNRGNSIIDDNNNEATAIDPGSYFGEIGYPEIDIITSIYSLVVGSLKLMRSPFKISYDFLESYNNICDEKIDKKNMKKSWKIIQHRFRYKYKRLSIILWPISYLSMHVLNVYITILIKRLNKLYD